MAEVSAMVMRQLEEAQARLDITAAAAGPPVLATVAASEGLAAAVGAAGCAQAQHVLVDHYFTSALRRLWVYAGGEWRYRDVTNVEEQGLAQIAYTATRVDACWDANNLITFLRCWKTF
jgi:hypothetical protein